MRKRIERAAKTALARFVSVFLSRKKIDADELARMRVERLLVIRQHNQMGDMLLAVPAFRGLRARFAGARITVVAAPINADVMRRNPYVDEVLVYAKEENRRNPFGLARFVAGLRRRRFDAVIVLNTVSFSVTSMMLAVASGARVRLGSTSRPFGHDLAARFYHLELPLPGREELARMHESAHNIYPLSAIGVRERNLASTLVPLPEEERDCDRFIAASFGEGARFIVVHPGAGKRQNMWPAERFAAVAAALRERFRAGTVVVSGPVDAEALAAFLVASGPDAIVISRPSVGFLGALMKRSALTLCNDTGIMHVAGAVGSRCVAVFGPTDPARWKPINDTVVAVKDESGNVESVGADGVIEAAVALLRG
ncbi:MAG: glycosyltransferase family 9 protein [Candidatus Krumholzibacteria bacterium]|nr:glycosyltransferase family 9 protein [Candidatus Krumholzibacteria bacterium]